MKTKPATDTFSIQERSSAHALSLCFHGIGVRVESADPEILELVRHDFSFFVSSAGTDRLTIKHSAETPRYDQLPVMDSTVSTPRNICYSHGGLTYIDYFGRALNIYDQERGHCDVITPDTSLAREIIFLTILSRISEALETKGLCRIHGLGLAFKDQGIVLLLPCGGGKSTLAMRILTNPQSPLELISEDSPLISRDGFLYPFPLRIGVLPGQIPPGIDERFVRTLSRMEFGPKLTIDAQCFPDRIRQKPVRARILLLGIRSTGNVAEIKSDSWASALRHCWMNSIVGVGLYQGMEFITQKSAWETIRFVGLLLKRVASNLRLLWGVRVFSFTLGRDIGENHRVLCEFLNQHLKTEKSGTGTA